MFVSYLFLIKCNNNLTIFFVEVRIKMFNIKLKSYENFITIFAIIAADL
jgi:hypothetical protein